MAKSANLSPDEVKSLRYQPLDATVEAARKIPSQIQASKELGVGTPANEAASHAIQSASPRNAGGPRSALACETQNPEQLANRIVSAGIDKLQRTEGATPDNLGESTRDVADKVIDYGAAELQSQKRGTGSNLSSAAQSVAAKKHDSDAPPDVDLARDKVSEMILPSTIANRGGNS